jgi:hypothetical protein
MNKFSRRKFLIRAHIYNASIIVGTDWLSSCENSYGKSFVLDYLPTQNTNPSISRWSKKCEDCGDCTEVCREEQKVFGTCQQLEAP